MSQALLEKLELVDDKNLLIQGLPSSIDKLFCKLSFAKNVTPLLRSKKIDFALVFAINDNQLNDILKDVMTALCSNSKLWVAYPKSSSKIVTDINRDGSWSKLTDAGYESIDEVTLDHTWTATRFKKFAEVEA